MQSVLNNPALLAFAGNLLQSAGGNRDGFGQSFGGALSGLAQIGLYQQEQARQRRQDQLKGLESSIGIAAALGELQKQRSAAEAARAQQERLSAFGQTLPADHQAAFAADPAGYLEWYQANQLPKSPTPLTEDQRLDNARADARLALDRQKYEAELASGGAEATAALKTRATKIESLMRLHGLDEATATAIVDNQVRLESDPVTGGILRHNLASGDTQPVEVPRAPAQYLGGEGQAPVSIEDMAAQTGVIPKLGDYFARTYGQVDPRVVSTAKVEAQTSFRFIRNQLRSALTNNPRGAVWELKQIDEMLPEEGFLESPARAAQSFRTAKSMVKRMYDFNADQINSGQLTKEVEKQLIEKNVQLQGIWEMLGTDDQLDALSTIGPTTEKPAPPPKPRDANEALKLETRLRGDAKAMGLNWSDVQATAKKYGETPEQVLQKLRGRTGG